MDILAHRPAARRAALVAPRDVQGIAVRIRILTKHHTGSAGFQSLDPLGQLCLRASRGVRQTQLPDGYGDLTPREL